MGILAYQPRPHVSISLKENLYESIKINGNSEIIIPIWNIYVVQIQKFPTTQV
jgi:hypothetical protein